ncbi:MAG: hypothetical protein ABSD82_05845 [Solirubrobacteraceae bacterium]
MARAHRIAAIVFAGDRRVWRTTALVAVPFVALVLYYCLRPNPYYTGTDSVEDYTYVVPTAPHQRVCVPDVELPAGTAIVQLRLISQTTARPELKLTLKLAGGAAIRSSLPPVTVSSSRISNANFPIPLTPASPAVRQGTLCVTAGGSLLVNWGGTPLPVPPPQAPTLDGVPFAAALAIWYLPPRGREESYLEQAGAIFARAALFRPGIVGAWTYPVLLFVILPLLALLAVRCMAVAVAGRTRRLATWLFVIAAVNFCCWALITPAFQAPDEVDHFAYTQSLVERGEGPSQSVASPLARWSDQENLALQDMSFNTDHQVGDTKMPWLPSQQAAYDAQAARIDPSKSDGGGYTTSAVHGPIYYLALAPAYLIARGGSIFSQLTLMRFSSALIGALVVLFTFLLVRELAPGRPWLAVLAALLVAYEPMYGFISGVVNNDVGVNAGAAALELLLIRMLRRGITIPWGALTGALLIALPIIKGTGLSLYPVAGLVFAATLWRFHSRRQLLAWVALALGGLFVSEFSAHVFNQVQAASAVTGSTVITHNASAVTGPLHDIPGYLSYLWQAIFPRLGFLSPHFPPGPQPFYVIFVQRGWGAFGWYDVFFPGWVYSVIETVIWLTVGLAVVAAVREWPWLRRHWLETLALLAMPAAVIAGFEAAYYTSGVRPLIAEFGRYAFPAIGPLAALSVGALHVFGRRHMLTAGIVVLVAIVALSYSAQLLTLTSFYT